MCLALRELFLPTEVVGDLADRVCADALGIGHGPHFAPLPLGATYELLPNGKLSLLSWDWIAKA